MMGSSTTCGRRDKMQVVYHAATLMLSTESDPQFNKKKKHGQGAIYFSSHKRSVLVFGFKQLYLPILIQWNHWTLGVTELVWFVNRR